MMRELYISCKSVEYLHTTYNTSNSDVLFLLIGCNIYIYIYEFALEDWMIYQAISTQSAHKDDFIVYVCVNGILIIYIYRHGVIISLEVLL